MILNTSSRFSDRFELGLAFSDLAFRFGTSAGGLGVVSVWRRRQINSYQSRGACCLRGDVHRNN